MSPGSAILWNVTSLKRRSIQVATQGTEAKPPTPLETRKRKRNPENWLIKRRKMATNSGEQLTFEVKKRNGQKVNKSTKKKELKPPCGEKCRLECSKNFPEEIRLQIFNDFYATGNRELQQQQLSNLVSVHPKKRPRDKENVNSRQINTREYSLSKKGALVKVCQKMFLNTFAIDEKRIRNLLQNKTETGTPIGELRGRHQNHVRIDERVKPVMEHIMTFKVAESHYVRRDSKYEYLPSELNVSEMYQMYKELREGKNYPLEIFTIVYSVSGSI